NCITICYTALYIFDAAFKSMMTIFITSVSITNSSLNSNKIFFLQMPYYLTCHKFLCSGEAMLITYFTY
ncbi:MAG: hypothetical protein K6B68_09190, partial [Eubacterium sp.]|nr:hypothetical protein [Eubacterium sp.]